MPSNSCHSWFRLPKEVRPRELRRCRAAVVSIGAELNAITDVCEDHVGDEDENVAHLPLRGMPYVAKDVFDRIARRGQWGGARSPGPANADAAILRLLDAAGARQVAVSSMTTLAYEPSGHNAYLGRTMNPWHPDAISGGSSSGSAALVAARCAYLGIGSDTGGSIRIPAACCGVVGLKPGHGKLVTDGAMPLAPSLDVIGFITRRAEDLIRVWEVASPSSDAGMTISSVAVYSELLESSSSVCAAIRAALRTLRNLGISEREVSDVRAITQADRDALTIMQVEAARIHDDTSLSGGDPALSRRIAKGREISDAEMDAALGRRNDLLTAVLSSWQGCGAAILPVMAMPPPDATEVDPQSAQFRARTLYELSGLTRFVNALGLPAIAVPIGFDERGVPQSMQIVGRPDSEFALLRLAHLYQSNTKWLQQAPAICAATDLGESA
ncbi:amidase [Bradyrhizobium sp. AZCC 2289]|uniref:amidase n=1 Tax=Bradyrhizobium sp. AZCC 2289 TaxID=3117026 RepID=UPI002FF0E22F